MRDQNGNTLGDQDPDHLLQHIEEDYFVPSLLVNALKERGVNEHAIGAWLDFDGETIGSRDPMDTLISGALRRYLQRRIIPGTMGAGHIPVAEGVAA
jgi:hypothetical protein